MFCKNCGNDLTSENTFCPKCGYQKGSGRGFCANCGNELAPGANICGKCGYAEPIAQQTVAQGEAKSRIAAGLLGILLAGLGIHNFYLGYTGKAVAQLLLTLVGWCLCVGPIISAIWCLVEGIRILCGDINHDAKGIPLKE